MNKDKTSKLWPGIFPIMALLMVCGLTFLLLSQWLFYRCLWWECVDSGYFKSQEIQIPRDLFPDDLVYGTLGTDHNSYGAKQHDAQQIFWNEYKTSTAILDVFRYFGTSGAKRKFDIQVRILSELFDISSEQSDELSYQSAIADELFVDCGVSSISMPFGIYRCVFVARYKEDVISLNMSIDEQMSLKEFERIITYLDTVSAERLGH